MIMHFLEEQVDGNGNALAVCLSGRWLQPEVLRAAQAVAILLVFT